MYRGYVKGTVNVRSEPTANTNSTANIVRQMLKDHRYTASLIVKDSLGRDWLKLSTIENSPVTGMYIAKYISTVYCEEYFEEEPEVIGHPIRITTVEEFEVSDGSIKTRTTVWENPTVVEE